MKVKELKELLNEYDDDEELWIVSHYEDSASRAAPLLNISYEKVFIPGTGGLVWNGLEAAEWHILLCVSEEEYE